MSSSGTARSRRFTISACESVSRSGFFAAEREGDASVQPLSRLTRSTPMPDKKTLERVAKDKRQGKSASTQAGEFVREEVEHIRHGKHGARSTKQAIAIGLSKARRVGVDLKPPEKGKTSERTRKSAERAYARGHGAPAKRKPSAKRSRAIEQ